jgi:hypothetical protein
MTTLSDNMKTKLRDAHKSGTPLKVTTEELVQLGNKPKESPAHAIRRKCLECVGTAMQVDLCTSPTCPLWAFRHGNVWTSDKAKERVLDENQ